MAMRMRFAAGVALVAAMVVVGGGALRVSAQSSGEPAQGGTGAAPASTLKVDARLVNVPVVVHDKRGALVQNLAKENFVLQVDGSPQTIRYFNIDTDLPLTLGLLVDISLSQRNEMEDEQKASEAFLDDMLNGPKDRDKAFVIEFARRTDLLQDITSSKPKLQAALQQLDTPGTQGTDDTDSNTGGSRGGRTGGGTTLYDALFLSSDELMKKQTGRKAVVILSDGVDRGSKESLVESIEAAQRTDTIVYAVYFKGADQGGYQHQDGGGRHGGGFPGGGRGGGWPGGGGGGYPAGGGGRGGGASVDGRKVLQRMVDETGGRLFEVSKKQTVSDIYKQIGEELRAQYRLAFTPDKETSAAGYHRIDLSLTKSSPKDLFLQTRDGYYTGGE